MTELPRHRPGSAARSDASTAAMLVVGLGASAGGIAALQKFFSGVPRDVHAAYVVILHLSADHDSKLAQVLQSTTSMAVSQVTEPVTLESRHIYVISPSQSLKIVDGKLVPAEMTRSEERRSPVDVFFRTLADAHRSRAVCIVLSGTGASGSIGLRHVKKHGGLTIVQRPDEAEYADMPRNSIATGLVDYVLPIAEMPSKIAAYQRMVRDVDESEPPERLVDEDGALRDVLALLRGRTGHDFSNYKPGTLVRRIERRMAVLELPTMGEYGQFIDQGSNSRALNAASPV
jgi:two-component system CheB/CheR fusion protein